MVYIMWDNTSLKVNARLIAVVVECVLGDSCELKVFKLYSYHMSPGNFGFEFQSP